MLWAMSLAVVMVLMNYLVFNLFDHAEVAGREMIGNLLKRLMLSIPPGLK